MNKMGNRLLLWWRAAERGPQGEKFGLGLSIALALMASIAMARGLMARMETLALVSAALLAGALLAPKLLAIPAGLLEEIFKAMTKALMYVLLVLVFFIVFAPAGLMLRILGKDPLQQKLDPNAESYWLERKPRDPSRTEKQF